MATRTQRPVRPHSTSPRSLSKSPRIGVSSKYSTNMQALSRPHTRDGAATFQNVRDISMLGAQREGQYTLHVPTSNPSSSKSPFPRAPRPHGLAMEFGSQDPLEATDATYSCPKPSGVVKLRGVSCQGDMANTHPMNDRNRAYAPAEVGTIPVSASTGALTSPIASFEAETPASSSIPLLATALQRLRDSDLETFKLERACGMAPDPARLARLAGAFSADEEVAGVLSGLSGSRHCDAIDAMEGIESSTSSLYLHSPSSPQTPHMNRKYALQQPHAQRTSRGSPPPSGAYAPPIAEPNSKLSRHSTLPSSSSAPASLNRTSRNSAAIRSALRTERIVIPPFVPSQNPLAQLRRLEVVVGTHGGKWGIGMGYTKSNMVGEKFESLRPLIGIDELLIEHSLDARLEFIRTEMERQSEGVGYMERFSVKGKEKALGRPDLTWRAPMCIVDINDPQYRVFGQPLHLSKMYASCVASMCGYQHDLPIVVFACVEELYRTGMTVPGLFRSPPDRMRHNQLINAYDFGPGFGKSVTLAKESTADICALLLSFIERMPRALWHESLYTALWKLCVKPSIQKEKEAEDAERKGMEEEDAGYRRHSTTVFGNFDGTFGRGDHSNPSLVPQRTRSSSLDSSSLYGDSGSVLDAAAVMNIHSKHNPAVLAAAQRTIAAESAQIEAARALFRLLPRAQFSLLCYLLAFFTQIPLSPQNQMTYEDVARIFAVPILLGKPPAVQRGAGGVPVSPTKEMREEWQKKKEQARSMMLWVLRRWSHISPGLFTPDEDSDHGAGIQAVVHPTQNERMDVMHSTSSSEVSGSASSRTSSSSNDWSHGPLSLMDAQNCVHAEKGRLSQHAGRHAAIGSSPSFAAGEHWPIQSCPFKNSALATTTAYGNSDGIEAPAWKSVVDRDICELRRELDTMKRRLEHFNAMSSQDATMLPA